MRHPRSNNRCTPAASAQECQSVLHFSQVLYGSMFQGPLPPSPPIVNLLHVLSNWQIDFFETLLSYLLGSLAHGAIKESQPFPYGLKQFPKIT